MKAQASMMAILIAMVLLIFIVIFMLTTSFNDEDFQSSRAEYRNLFASNLLLSLLNTDTECGKFSDMLKADYFGGGRCTDGFTDRIDDYMTMVLNETGYTNYRWLIEAEPKDFIGGVTKTWGDETVKDSLGFWSPPPTILTWSGSPLEVKLYIRST